MFINKDKPSSVNRGIDIKDNYKVGVFMMVITSICFALMAVIVKYLKHLPLMEIVLFRNIPTMIIIPIILKKKDIPLFGNNKLALLIRGFFGVIGMVGMFYTYTIMPLTDAVTIQRLSPFFIVIRSGIFLKEKLYFQQIPIFVLAFLGGLLVIRPGLRLDIFPAIIGLIAAISMAAAHVILRHLRLTDHHLVIINYYAYISGLLSLIVLVFSKNNLNVLTLNDLLFFFLIGIIALVAQITLTKAYQMAPASLVSLYTYSQIIFACIFSLLFFKEIPSLLTLIGASLIIISGYLNYKLRIE